MWLAVARVCYKTRAHTFRSKLNSLWVLSGSNHTMFEHYMNSSFLSTVGTYSIFVLYFHDILTNEAFNTGCDSLSLHRKRPSPLPTTWATPACCAPLMFSGSFKDTSASVFICNRFCYHPRISRFLIRNEVADSKHNQQRAHFSFPLKYAMKYKVK